LVKQDQLDELNKPDESDRPGLSQAGGALDFRQADIVIPGLLNPRGKSVITH
jgi:hypothetical protein